MSIEPDPGEKTWWPHDPVGNFALQVISEVKKRPAGGVCRRLDGATSKLTEMVSFARFEVNEVLRRMRGENVTEAEVLDYCIPRAAAFLGQHWCDNRMSFAEVSVGSARLHGLCRAASGAWSATAASPNGFAILVVVCENEEHFLGQSVIAAQLRRAGHSVRCLLGATAPEVVNALQRDACDAVLISSSGRVAFETVEHITKTLRDEVKDLPPLIVGGAILDHHDRVLEKTGADLVTKDLDLVLGRLKANPFGAMKVAAE